jgi:hypothetical protein
MEFVLPLVQLNTMNLVMLLLALLVELVVILVTILVTLVLVMIVPTVTDVNSHFISTSTNVFHHVHPVTLLLILHNLNVVPVTLLVWNVTDQPMLIVLIAQKVPTYTTEPVLPFVQKVCSKTITSPQKPVTLVTLLVVAVPTLLNSVNVVLKVCISITILVFTHVQKDISLIQVFKLVLLVIHLV